MTFQVLSLVNEEKEAGTFTSQYGCRTAAVSYEKGRKTVTVVFTYKTGWNKAVFQ